MNPLIKLMLKQIEDSAIMIERAAKASEKIDYHYETKMNADLAFEKLHIGIAAVKHIVGELL